MRAREAILPLSLVALLLGVPFALDRAGVMMFTRPWAFALTALVPWFWWMSAHGAAGLVGVRRAVALAVRLLLVALFIGVLAQPRSVREHEGLAVLFAMDRSASIEHGAADQAMRYVAELGHHQKPAKDEAGLVIFGRDAAVELPPSASFPLEAINVQVDRDGTNLERALTLSAAMLPDDRQGRIVLISDGSETEGSLKTVLDELKSRRIAVDVLPIDYTYPKEVWLERLELPRHVKVGETYEAAVILSSVTDGSGTLILRENGREIARQPVQYAAGKNRFVVPIYLRQAGYYEYEALLDPDPGQDGFARNNKAISYLYLQGEGRVLVVKDPNGDPRDTKALVEAMRGGQRAVDVMTAYELPTEPLSLLPYDAVLLVNAPADAMTAPQMQALHDAVYHQGAGLIMVGGANSFGPGGFHRTVIEDALPVSMDVTQKKVMPKGALGIILHTCEFPEGNTWAKNITKQAIKVLSSQDEVGVLVYDWQGGEKWLFPLTPAGQYDQLVPLINNAQIGDMPTFDGTMKQAFDALRKSDAASKHLIIISDGDPSPPEPALLADYLNFKISVTTVAVFPHNNDVTVMQSIAQATGGRFYYPQDASTLPSIFIKEAKTLRRSMIQNKTITPVVRFPSPILKGIDAMPPLRGYVLTTPKERSTTVLQSPEPEETEPVLSTWRYGVGKTAAFTSDLSPNWAADWMGWERYQAFVNQLITDISRTREPTHLRVHSEAVGGKAVITVEDEAPQADFLRVEAMVAGPKEQKQTLQLEQVGPRRYEARFDLWGEGRYQVTVAGSAGARQERVHGGFVVPYSQEYLRFRANPIVLEQIAQATGGRMLTGTEKGEQLYAIPREKRRSTRPIFDWFLIALACLVPLDVGIRRVQLDWSVIKGWFGLHAAAPSQETFNVLLRRKQDVSSTLRSTTPAEPMLTAEVEFKPFESPGRTATQAAGKPDVSAKPQAASDEQSNTSTTERLLALKRRRQDAPPGPSEENKP